MAYPDIFPIKPGQDGWQPSFSTSARRVLFHCGLLPDGVCVSTKWENPRINWKMPAKPIPAWMPTPETRPLPVTIGVLRKALWHVYRRRGVSVVKDILKVHGNATTAERVKPSDYRHVYLGCVIALENNPAARVKRRSR